MYKNRHSGGNKNTRGQGAVAVSRDSLHFNAFCTHQHYSQNRKPGIFKGSCHIVPSDIVKLRLLQQYERDTEWSQLGRSVQQKSINTLSQRLPTPPPRRSPTHCATVCVSERRVPWQCGQSGPFKSPWAAGESPRDDSTGQNDIKKRQQQKSNTTHSTRISPISQTMSYVHLKTNFSFCFVFFPQVSTKSLEYKNRFLMFFVYVQLFVFILRRIENKLHIKI